MIVEMLAHDQNQTWKLVPLPLDRKSIGCWWVYAIKGGPNGHIDCFKERLGFNG